jgi:hypothetical protein
MGKTEKVDVMVITGDDCPFLMCLETGPHTHPICPTCGAVRYGAIQCTTCAEFQRLQSYSQLPAESAARYLYLLGKVDVAPHPETVMGWARAGLLETVKIETGCRGRPQLHITTESCEKFKPPTPGGRRGPRPKGANDGR